VVLSADSRKFTVDEEVEIVDGSAGSDSYKPKYATQFDATANVELVGQTGGTVLWAAVAPASSGTLEWGPEGTATGKPRHYAIAIVSKRTKDIPYDDVVTLNIDFDISGTITNTAY
jgi:hypothetical protein